MTIKLFGWAKQHLSRRKVEVQPKPEVQSKRKFEFYVTQRQRELRDRYTFLENSIIEQKFDLTSDTNDLERNLDEFSNSETLSKTDALYINIRFIEKARLIRQAYGNEFELLARKFEAVGSDLMRQTREAEVVYS